MQQTRSSKLATAPFGKATSSMIGARVSNDQLRAVKRLAASGGFTVGGYIRACVLSRAAAKMRSQDPAALVAQIAIELGLPHGTPPLDVLKALRDLVASLGGPEAARPESPDLPPAKRTTLSADELAACKKRGIEPAEFLRRKQTLARRA